MRQQLPGGVLPMKKYLTIALVGALVASAAWAQNKVFSSEPNQDNLPVKQMELNLETMRRNVERMHREIGRMKPVVDAMASCQGAGKVYAPGAAGMGRDADGNDADTTADGCVTLTGAPLVTEIRATTASIAGNMGSGNATTNMQDTVNAYNCPTADGWHACSDDEVIYAMDQRVSTPTGGTALDLIDNSTYWVRSMMPFRFDQTDAAAGATTLNCSGWSSTSVSGVTIVGTMFNGSTVMPRFDFGLCNVARKLLCCR